MDDTIILRHHAIVCQTEFCRILRQHVNLLTRYRVLDGFILVVCRRIVIGHAVYSLRTEAFQSPGPHTLESLRRRHFVAVEAVDIKLCRPVFHLLHHVLIPYLVK